MIQRQNKIQGSAASLMNSMSLALRCSACSALHAHQIEVVLVQALVLNEVPVGLRDVAPLVRVRAAECKLHELDLWGGQKKR